MHNVVLRKFHASFLLTLFVSLIVIDLFNPLCADVSKADAAAKVVSLLRLGGQAALNKIDNDPNPKCKAFSVALPGTNLKAIAFYGQNSWYAAVDFDIEKLEHGKKILTDVYESMSKFLETPELKSLTLVVGEKNGVFPFDALPQSLQNSLANYKDHNKYAEEQKQVTFSQGVNLYASITPASSGPLAAIQRVVLLGGSVEGEVRLSGSVGFDLLTKVLKSGKVAQDASSGSTSDKPKPEDLKFRLELPNLVPPPFSFMNKQAAKKLFFMELTKTFLDISFQKGQLVLGGGRGVIVSILGKEFTVACDLTLTEKKSSGHDSQFDIALAGSIDLPSPQVVFPPLLKLHTLTLKGSYSSDFSATDTEKVLDMGVDAVVSLGSSGKYSSGIMAEITREHGETSLKSIELNLKQDGKGNLLSFGDIPGAKDIPFIREFTIKDVAIGICPANDIPSLYLSGTMGWKRGGSSYQFALWEKDASFFLMARASDFVLSKILGMKFGTDVLDAVKMPDALLVLSSPNSNAKPVRFSELPSRLKSVFKGFETGAAAVPVCSDGIALMTKLDVDTMKGPFLKFNKEFGLDGMGMKGEVILAGSLVGLLEDQPKVELSVSLTGFHFPDKQPLGCIVSLKSADVKFFLRVDVPATAVQVGLRSDLNVAVPRVGSGSSDSMTFAGELYLNVCSVGYGVRVGAFRTGDWNDPFGIGNLKLTDTALLFGIDGEGALEVGFGGGFSVKGLENRARVNNACLTPDEKKELVAGLMDNASAPAKVTKDISEKIGGVVNCIIARPPIPKKIAFYFSCTKAGLMPVLEANESLLQGIIAGPGTNEFVKLLPESEKKVCQDILSRIAKTSLIDLFKLRDLPLPLIDLEDMVVYFSTPGASLPGFKEINGMGFSIKGKTFLTLLGRRYSLNETEITLTLSQGLILKCSGPVFDLGALKMSDTGIDLHAGIPVLHGSDVPHFTISGKGQLLFYKGDLLMHLGLDGIVVSASADFGPFGKTSFEARSQGKDLLHATDFTFASHLALDVHGGIQEEVKKQFLGSMQGELSDAKNTYDKALAAVKKLNQDIQKARQDALKRQERVSDALIAAQQKHVDALQAAYDALNAQLDDCQKKWWKRKTAGLIRLAMKLVAADLDASRAVLEKAKSAVAGAQSMVDLDPVVAGLLITRTAAVAALNVADVILRGLQGLQDQLLKGVNELLKTAFSEQNLTIRKLDLSAATIKSGGELKFDQDMTIYGMVIQDSVKITGNDLHAVQMEILKKITDPIIDAVKSEYQRIAAEAKTSFKPEDIDVKPGDIVTVVQAALPGTPMTAVKPVSKPVRVQIPQKLDFGKALGVIDLKK